MSEIRLPKTTYKSKYPYNHVFTSESGHQTEIDDTPGHERLRESHKSGTYWEISPDGRKVELIVVDDYKYIKGGMTLTVDYNGDIKIGGNLRLVIEKDAYIEVGGDVTSVVKGDSHQVVKGDSHLIVEGSTEITSKKTLKLHSDDSIELTAKSEIKITADGDVHIKGSDIHESPPDPHS